jgi:hypothetical protein
MPQIIEITALGSDETDAAQLPDFTDWDTVILVTTTGAGQGIKAPANARAGDRMEVYLAAGSDSFKVYSEDDSFTGFNNSSGYLRRLLSGWGWVAP